MKLRRGETKVVNLPIEGVPLEREAKLNMVQGKALTEGKEIVSNYNKTTKTAWLDKRGEPQVYSYDQSVVSITVKPWNAEEKQRELLDELKAGLEAISNDDASLEDIRRALRAQIAYSEFMDQVND